MDTQLLIALAVGIAAIIVIVLKTRLDAFVALLIASLLTGLVAGQSLPDTLSYITTGFGNTLGGIGLVIGLGVALGKIMEVSGAADSLARAMMGLFGKGKEDIAMGYVGAVVSIPVFADSAFMIMAPLARAVARVKGKGFLAIILVMSAAMSLAHTMVPPTPGPLAVAGILGADLGMVILVGLIFTAILVPVGVVYARWADKKYTKYMAPEVRQAVYGSAGDDSQALEILGATAVATASAGAAASAGAGLSGAEARTRAAGRVGGTGGRRAGGADSSSGDDPALLEADATGRDAVDPDNDAYYKRPMGALRSLLPLAAPLLLIFMGTFATTIDRNNQGVLHGEFEPSTWAVPLTFVGHPVIALTIGAILAVYTLLPRYTPRKKVHGWLAQGASEAGLILLITGAGGGFGLVLRSTGIGDALGDLVGGWHIPMFLIPFVISLFVRIAQGSATVAMITAASIVAPLVTDLGLNPVVATLAAALASGGFSHFNDSFFWIVTKAAGLEGSVALKAWTGIKGVTVLAGLPLLWVLSLIMT